MRVSENLVLTGFMGTGKTTVGRVLADRLCMEFVDTDELIESTHGQISQIFTDRGEGEFRAIERAVAAELGQKEGLVISTGGRMLLDSDNYRSLSRNGRIFCLVAAPESILARVSNDPLAKDRPLLDVDSPLERITQLMAEREPGYARFRRIPTDGRLPSEIADEIADLWSTQTS